MIIEYLLPRALPPFYLLDTFEGFADAMLTPQEHAQVRPRYNYPRCIDSVRETFASFSFVTIIPGVVPHTLPQVASTQVAFLSIDMNCAAPEVAAAEYFWPRLNPGATIVLDDYGFSAHLEQKRQLDAFAARKGVSVLLLPTGQGIIFKPVTA